MKIEKYEIHGDEQGSLIALEEGKEIPFNIRRVYYMYGTSKGFVRGKHAHRKLEQVLVCVHGSCRLLLDDGVQCEECILDSPDEGVYIPRGSWREIRDISEDAVIMVLASELYCEEDYIRDYEEFLEYIEKTE